VKHTPGPFIHEEPLDMEGMHHIWVKDLKGHILCRVDGYLNGELCGETGHPDREETIANADLFTASPMLLEACRMAHRLLLQIGDEEDYCTRTINELWIAIKAAGGRI